MMVMKLMLLSILYLALTVLGFLNKNQDPTRFEKRYGLFHSGHGELSHRELVNLEL